MTGAIASSYLGGWLLTSMVALLVARRTRSTASSPRHAGWLSIVAGAAWPVIVFGVVEVWVIAVIARAVRVDDRPLPVDVAVGVAPDGSTCKDQLSY